MPKSIEYTEEVKKTLFENKHKVKIFATALKAGAQVLGAMDSIYATPLRDWQVFGGDSFHSVAGMAKHAILSPITAAFTFVGSLPFIARLFFKDHVNNLGKMLDNVKKEFPDNELGDDEALKARFNDFLQKRGHTHLKAHIVPNKKGKKSLRFTYNDPMVKFIDKHWEAVKNKNLVEIIDDILNENKSVIVKKIEAYDNVDNVDFVKKILSSKNIADKDDLMKLIQLLKTNSATITEAVTGDDYFTKEEKENFGLLSRLVDFFPYEDGAFSKQSTLADTRQAFLDKMNKITAADVILKGYETVNDFTFSFWLGYLCNDLIDGREDSTLWDRLDQILILAIAGGVAAVQAVLKIAHFFSNKPEPEIHSVNTHYSNKMLKHQLIEEFFIEEVNKKRLRLADAANNNKNQYNPPSPEKLAETKTKINAILMTEGDESSAVSKQFALLKKAYNPDLQLGKRIRTVVTHAMAQGILLGFIGWVVGAALVTAGAVVLGTLTLGIPVSVGLFVLGMSLGATWFANRQTNQDKTTEENGWKQLAVNEDKINQLKKLDTQNEKLRNLLENEKNTPLTIAKTDDDRFYRRVTTTKGGALSIVKKTLTHLFFGIDKTGAGILIMRLTVLPLLSLGVAAAIGGPIGMGIALGFGLAWGIFCLVKHHQDRKLAACQRTLDDIDNRILTAENNKAIYLKQLKYDVKPQTKQKAVSNLTILKTREHERNPAPTPGRTSYGKVSNIHKINMKQHTQTQENVRASSFACK